MLSFRNELVCILVMLMNVASPLTSNRTDGGSKKKYYVFKAYVDFDTATKECNDRGYRLLAIENQAEFEELNELLKNYGETELYWTSGRRIKDGEYIWESTNGSIDPKGPMWMVDEPSGKYGYDPEECIELAGKKHHRKGTQKPLFVLNDSICTWKKNFICEELIQHVIINKHP